MKKVNVGRVKASFKTTQGNFEREFEGKVVTMYDYTVTYYATQLLSDYLIDRQKEGFYHCGDGISVPLHNVLFMTREYEDYFVEYEVKS